MRAGVEITNKKENFELTPQNCKIKTYFISGTVVCHFVLIRMTHNMQSAQQHL